MKLLLLTSLLGAAAGASSLTTYHVIHETGGGNGRYEMQVLPNEETVVTLDRESGTVRFIYKDANAARHQWAIEMKPGAQMGEITPPELQKNR